MKRKRLCIWRRIKRKTNIVSSLHVNFHLCSPQSRESKQITSFTIKNVPNISRMLLVQLRRVGVAASSVMWLTLTIRNRKFIWYGEVIRLMKLKKNYSMVCDIYLGIFSKKSRKAHFSNWYLHLQLSQFSFVQCVNISFHVKCYSWYHGMASVHDSFVNGWNASLLWRRDGEYGVTDSWHGVFLELVAVTR